MNNSVQNVSKKKNSLGKETTQVKEFQRENAYHPIHHISRRCPVATWLSGSFISLDHSSILCSMEMWKKMCKRLSAENQKCQRALQIRGCAIDKYFHHGETMKSPRGESVWQVYVEKKINGDHHQGKWGIKGKEWE